MYGVNDSKGFLNAKVKVTFTLNDRDDADDFSKSLGQKNITVINKGFNSGGSQSGSTTTKKYNYSKSAINETRIINDTL